MPWLESGVSIAKPYPESATAASGEIVARCEAALAVSAEAVDALRSQARQQMRERKTERRRVVVLLWGR